MKITSEMLERFGVQFNNGTKEKEFSETIETELFPAELYHYIRKYYRLTEEEFNLYCKHCNIKDSENFWDSSCITNSKNLINSFDVTDSFFVRNSESVQQSKFVYNSDTVRESNDIVYSKYISRSQRVLESQDVTNSEDVARSNDIDWCSVILNSSRLKDCSYTYMSQDLVDCHFCGFMKNSRRCLFCVGLEGKEYYIFNEPVTPKEYEQIKEKMLSLLEEEQSTMIKVKPAKYLAEERYKLNRRFDSIIDGLSKEFFGWVGTLPNYSDNTYVDLFFRDREVN